MLHIQIETMLYLGYWISCFKNVLEIKKSIIVPYWV